MFKKVNLGGFKEHTLKIFELKTYHLIQVLDIRDEDMIGRIKSDLFTFTEGNIYFNNCMIKIRYDLLDKNDSMLTADQVFDFYPDIF
jgi:hypothetical protein